MVKSIIKKANKTDSKVKMKEDKKKISKSKVEPKVEAKIILKAVKPVKEEPQIKAQIVEKVKEKKPKSVSLPIIKEIIEEKHIVEEIVKPTEEIHSLQELEEKILEKFDEDNTEIKELKEELIKNTELPKVTIKFEDKTETDYKSRVEAILFAVGKYLDEETISQLCDIDKRHTKKALEELKKEYDTRNTALMVVQEGNNWKINVREKYLSLVRKIVADTELSKSIMETLAVIAWKTPVYQNEIVRIRGNKCYDHIEELVNSGLVTKDKKGRSYVLKTTDKFYNYFDIDRKNLQGVMNEAKMPTKQTTLDEASKTEEVQEYSRERLLHALDTIETKSIVQTEEDKLNQKEFLDRIHQKIEDASKRTDEVVAELPRPMHEQEQVQPVIEDIPPPLEGDAVVEKDEENIVINTEVTSTEHHFQKPEDQIKKAKSLTKKQLEKKFKEELQRVKDKTEEKKK